MNHLFLKLPVTQLGQAPYHAYSLDARDVLAAKLGLNANPAANVHTVENIAGFVGSDITAVGLAVEMNSADKMTLVVDIGTNGELIIGTKQKLYAASCAAGPALEGARIDCGSRAVPGAIETVIINGEDIDLDVIANHYPTSICGSGLIDAVAVLLELGIVDSTGRFIKIDDLRHLPTALRDRLIKYNSQPAFLLAKSSGPDTKPVILTQNDIRQVQLAKGAIRTGIKLLQKKLNLNDEDINQVLLAGAFGNYIRRENAVRIGLLPDMPLEKIHFVGNAASSGARIILLSEQARKTAKKFARSIEYVEIAHEPGFADIYAESMLF